MQLVSEALKKMRIAGKVLSREEHEDIGLVMLIKQADSSEKILTPLLRFPSAAKGLSLTPQSFSDRAPTALRVELQRSKVGGLGG